MGKLPCAVLHRCVNALWGSPLSPSRNLEKVIAAAEVHKSLGDPRDAFHPGTPGLASGHHQDAALHHHETALGCSMASVRFCLHQHYHTRPYFNANMYED